MYDRKKRKINLKKIRKEYDFFVSHVHWNENGPISFKEYFELMWQDNENYKEMLTKIK